MIYDPPVLTAMETAAFVVVALVRQSPKGLIRKQFYFGGLCDVYGAVFLEAAEWHPGYSEKLRLSIRAKIGLGMRTLRFDIPTLQLLTEINDELYEDYTAEQRLDGLFMVLKDIVDEKI